MLEISDIPTYIWIGTVSSRGNCRAVRIEYLSESIEKDETPAHYHYFKYHAGERWRYQETANVVMWYQYPDALQRHAVQDYLLQRNIHVNRHYVYGSLTDDHDYDVFHGHITLPNYFKKIKGKPRSWKLITNH